MIQGSNLEKDKLDAPQTTTQNEKLTIHTGLRFCWWYSPWINSIVWDTNTNRL